MPENLGPDTPCSAYNDMRGSWKMVRDLMGGTEAMRTAGRAWLPQWPQESIKRYDARLKGSFLFGGLRRTIETLTGKVFSREIQLGRDVSPAISNYTENIDLEGNSLNVFARDWFQDGLQVGVSHLVVDKSSLDAMTKAEALQNGIRPYWVRVPAEALIAWSYIVVNGRRVLTEARIKESETAKDGEWGEKRTEQVRRWQLRQGPGDAQPVAYWSLWEKRKGAAGDAWTAINAGRTSMTEIPLVTFYADRTGFMTGRPPLLDLAWKNIEHWQSASEQRHVLQIGRRPALYFLGFEREELAAVEIGPHTGLRSSKVDAKVGFAEITGASIGAGRQDLETLKEEMAMLGAEMLVQTPTSKTATESSNERAERDSKLGMIVGNFQDAMENGLRLTAMWEGEQDGGSVVVNRDWGLSPLDSAELSTVMQARQTGEISRALFWRILKQRGVIPEDWDMEKEQAAIEAEAL